MTTQTEALKLALEALESCHITFHEDEDIAEAITAIKEALAQPEQEPKCNPHPKAPHGFNRNASHANDRYTCECEGWDAYDAGYQAGVMAGIEASMGQEPEQEPVAWMYPDALCDKACLYLCTKGFTQFPECANTPPQRKPDHTEDNLEMVEKQEPVVWMYQDKSTHEVRFQKHMRDFVDHGATYETPLYTTPPQRTWEGLSVFEINDLVENTEYEDYRCLVERTEAKLKGKNT